MHQPILRDWIWAQGRGPILRRVHHDSAPAVDSVALEYLDPDYRSDADIGHLAVYRAQVSMFTPHEVYSYARDRINWGPALSRAAVVNLHKSEWLPSLASASSPIVITTA
jgi:hypothetical protein